MFHSARLKLTAWYLLIIMVISLSFSTVIYHMFSVEVERFSRIQRLRIERGLDNLTPPPRIVFDETFVNEEQERVIVFLALVNLGVLVLSGGLGYFLAGRTLLPIADMVDEQHRFISDASHELRTPLTALKSSLEVNLRDPKLTLTDAKKLMKESVTDVNKLQSLSDALLQLAQYQTPTTVVKFTRIQLATVIQTAIHRIEGLAKQKHISIRNDTSPITMEANEYGLTDLLIILLDNAIKYSAHNSSVTVNAKRIDDTVAINIIDHGVGISSGDIPHIFDRFYRADAARSKETADGYGLGLSIAKKIVKQHNGTINVASTLKKGTTFTICLPLS